MKNCGLANCVAFFMKIFHINRWKFLACSDNTNKIGVKSRIFSIEGNLKIDFVTFE